jgi:hypothetical protein
VNDDTKSSLLGAGLSLLGDLVGIAGKAIMGAYVSPEQIRADMLAATDRFLGFIAPGGEMDTRRDAARAKTDKAFVDAEKAQPLDPQK